jgi:predicted O-methyltransferase YrrM
MRLQNIKQQFYWYFRNPKYIENLFFFIFYKILKLIKKKDNLKLDINIVKKYILTLDELFKIKNFVNKPINFLESSIYIQALHKINSKSKKIFGGAAYLNLLYNLAKIKKNGIFLETGVALGWSSLAFLSSSSKSLLTSIDMPYIDSRGEMNLVGTAVPEIYHDRWKLIVGSDRQEIPKIKNKKFDIIHYDSDKSYYGRFWAYKMLWNFLDSNGIFISDDIGDNFAFYDFAKFKKRKIYIFENKKKFIGLIFKNEKDFIYSS